MSTLNRASRQTSGDRWSPSPRFSRLTPVLTGVAAYDALLPPVLRGGAHFAKVFAIVVTLAMLSTSCVAPEFVRAPAIKPSVDLVSIRHDQMLRGELNPASVSSDDKDAWLRTSEMLRATVDEAASGAGSDGRQ